MHETEAMRAGTVAAAKQMIRPTLRNIPMEQWNLLLTENKIGVAEADQSYVWLRAVSLEENGGRRPVEAVREAASELHGKTRLERDTLVV